MTKEQFKDLDARLRRVEEWIRFEEEKRANLRPLIEKMQEEARSHYGGSVKQTPTKQCTNRNKGKQT